MKCQSGCGCRILSRLCPFAFAMALGITCALCMFVMSLWVAQHGMPMPANHPPMPGAEDGMMGILYAFIKGFVSGFIFALIYDCFIWCKSCCRCCSPKSSSAEQSSSSCCDKK